MRTRRDLLHLTASLLIVPSAGSALAAFDDPAAVVKALYATYGVGDNSNSGFNERLATKLFDRDLLKLYKRAATAGLDYDFFVQGQDFSLARPISIDRVEIRGSSAKVWATLEQSFGGDQKVKKDSFTFSLVKEASGWRLHDASCGGRSVSSEWKATAQ